MCTQEFSQFLAGTQCLPDMCDMQCIQIDSRCHMKYDARHPAWARPASSSCSGSSRSVRNGMAAVPAKRYWDRGTSSLSRRSLYAGRDSAWLGSTSNQQLIALAAWLVCTPYEAPWRLLSFARFFSAAVAARVCQPGCTVAHYARHDPMPSQTCSTRFAYE